MKRMVELLKWDSAFFNCKIGKYEAKTDVQGKELESLAKGFDLIYVLSKVPLQIQSSFKQVKLTYSKLTERREVNKAVTRRFSSKTDNYNDLLALTYLSGHRSRFLKDPFFGEHNFKRLYKEWIDKNIKKQDEFVLVHLIDNKIAGFVSYSLSNKIAVIELIAVSSNYQSKGVGKKLLDAVEFNLNSGTELIVSTQESNKQATTFYEKYGFSLTKKLYIYHYVPDTIQ